MALGARLLWLTVAMVTLTGTVSAEEPDRQVSREIGLEEILMRDPCILPDPETQTYYMVGAGSSSTAGGNRSVRLYTSKDLKTWHGPEVIFRPADDIWGEISVVGIWAPEIHKYQGKFYLFLTFDTRHELCEQWRNWLPRVTRGSQVLVADSPSGPYEPFQNRSTLPPDMMTLDGTLYVEDGTPYMVYCHEWVQIKDGTVEYMQLTEDLSRTVGEPVRLFNGSDAPWNRASPEYGCHVTDGPDFYRSTSGKLFMIWSSFSNTGYTCGIAESESGRLEGPWLQQEEPLYSDDGGHGTVFTTFDGKPMLVLHSPNSREAQPRIFELEDTGDTLRIVRPLISRDE